MSVKRIVPNIYSDDLEKSKIFYCDFLGLEIVMDMSWIITFASKENPTAQINVLENDTNQIPNNKAIFLSIEVLDVDTFYQKAIELNLNIVYPITDESWGVRRFFVKEPNGGTLNIVSHKK